CTAWTGGHTTACLTVTSIIILRIITHAITPQPITWPGIFGTHYETHTVLLTHPSKELKMKANTYNVYDEGRAPNVPQFNAVGAAGKPTPPKSKTSAKAGSAKW